MDHENNHNDDVSMAIYKPSSNSNMYRLMNNGGPPSLGYLEIRLFYVRVAPCPPVRSIPDRLTLHHLHRSIGISLEINGSRIPASESAYVTLRRDRVDKETSEVTYVSTDSVRVSGAVEFEVTEGEELILCGSLERMESNWGSDAKTGGWSVECYTSSSSVFTQPKMGVISSPSIEVYIAGCCSGVPVILTKMVVISPRRKVTRQGMLDAIPEDEEVGRQQRGGNGLVHRKMQITEADADDYESDGKIGHSYYADDMYAGEDGQLSWFNAGVRVGVGIGLGMCLGVGIGVGLLMRSYQATTRSFRTRFF